MNDEHRPLLQAIAVGFMLALALSQPRPAIALSCAGPSIEDALANADAIFLSSFALPLPGGDALFRVDRWWKSEVGRFAYVRGAGPYPRLLTALFGAEFFVIANHDGLSLYAPVCSGAFPTDTYRSELAELDRYPSVTPEPLWPKALALLIALVFLRMAIRRRLRSRI